MWRFHRRTRRHAAVAGAIRSTAALDSALIVTARLPDACLVGRECELIVDVSIGERWSLTKDAPQPLLQLDAPPSVRLSGCAIEGDARLSRSECAEEPIQQLISTGETPVRFALAREPERGEVVGVNVIAYLQSPEGHATFVRRRVELPLREGASGSSNDQASLSAWGRSHALRIGDKADALALPRADGSVMDLSEVLGKRPIVITTYRAHW